MNRHLVTTQRPSAARGYRPIFSYKVVNDYQAFLLNEAQVVNLRKRFEGYTGPVVNIGGVR